MAKEFTELVTDATAANWRPSEHFVNMVIDLAVCYGQLSGKVTAINYDLAAGNGNVVNVPYVATAAYDPNCTALSACSCISQVSATLANYPITINSYGILDEVCNFNEWETTPNIQAAVMNEMAKKMANCRDAGIWADLIGGTFTNVTTSGAWAATPSATTSVTCCAFALDIYNCIVTARSQLTGAAYNPDTVLIHPYVAAYLYYKEGGAMPDVQIYKPLMTHNADGSIKSILGMKVIEVCVAVADDSAPSDTGDELAFVLDSSRALGEAWGMRPKFDTFYAHKCDKTEITHWSYWGHALMEAAAVRGIISV